MSSYIEYSSPSNEFCGAKIILVDVVYFEARIAQANACLLSSRAMDFGTQ